MFSVVVTIVLLASLLIDTVEGQGGVLFSMLQPVGPGEQVAMLAAGTARDEVQFERVVLRIQANQGRLTARPPTSTSCTW